MNGDREIRLAEKLLSEAIVWSNDQQWFVCRYCKRVQELPFDSINFRRQLHKSDCFFVEALDALLEVDE